MLKAFEPIKLGVVGEPSSGKDTFAAYLVDNHGFVHISTGDLVRAYILENNLGDTTRPNMKQVSTFMRTEHGADYLARLALKEPAPHLVISGLRNVAEAEAIKTAGGKIVALRAPQVVRFERVGERNRVGDRLTFNEFRTQEAAEETDPNPNAQSVAKVIALGDYNVHNEGDLREFHANIEKFLQELS